MEHAKQIGGDVSELLRAFVFEGDETAYEQLCMLALQKVPHLLAYAKSCGVPESDAEELVHDALWDALKPEALHALWKKHGERADLYTHLFIKLRGRISTYKRRMQRRPRHLSFEGLSGTRREPISEPTMHATNLTADDKALFWQAVNECLNNELDVQILWLATRTDAHEERSGKRYTLKKVAEMLCISHDNARQRWCGATQKLRSCPKFYQVCREIGLISDGGKNHA